MTSAALPYIPAAIAWAAFLYKSPAFLRRRRDPAQRAYCLSLVFFASAMTALLPPIYLGLDHLAGVPNLARLVGNSAGLASAWMAQAFLAYLNYPKGRARTEVRRFGWLVLITVIAMTVLFLFARVSREDIDFWARYAEAPYMPEYRFAFLAYLGAAMGNGAYLAWRNATITQRPALAFGLRIVSVGCIVGLAYVIEESLLVVAVRLGLGTPSPQADTVAKVLIATATALIVLGSTLPSWATRAGMPALYEWLFRYRAYRHLYPLWPVLYRVRPEIALLPPRSPLRDRLTIRDLDLRLYRRVVEIRDGFLALRPYVDPAVPSWPMEVCQAAGLGNEETDAVIQAVSVAAAIDAKRRGCPRRRDLAAFRGGGGDIGTEIALLERVARCYTRSPIVRAAVTLIEQEDAVRNVEDVISR